MGVCIHQIYKWIKHNFYLFNIFISIYTINLFLVINITAALFLKQSEQGLDFLEQSTSSEKVRYGYWEQRREEQETTNWLINKERGGKQQRRRGGDVVIALVVMWPKCWWRKSVSEHNAALTHWNREQQRGHDSISATTFIKKEGMLKHFLLSTAQHKRLKSS